MVNCQQVVWCEACLGSVLTSTGYAVESAITLLDNAFTQMSMLCHQRVLKEYNKELLTFAQGRETEFLKAVPELFEPKFPCDVTEHLDQLAALRKLKSSSSNAGSLLGFRKPPSYHSNQRYYSPRQRPQSSQRRKGAHQEETEGSQITINKQFYCMSQYNSIPILLKVQSMGSKVLQRLWSLLWWQGGWLPL